MGTLFRVMAVSIRTCDIRTSKGIIVYVRTDHCSDVPSYTIRIPGASGANRRGFQVRPVKLNTTIVKH